MTLPPLVLEALAIAGGIAFLVWGADRFVLGAAALANNMGVSPLLIGLTIVGFGTSAPEMLVSAVAASRGASGLSVGNAIGSNITNVALVLGAAALISPLEVHSKVIRRELPVLILVSAATLALLWFFSAVQAWRFATSRRQRASQSSGLLDHSHSSGGWCRAQSRARFDIHETNCIYIRH